MRGFRDPRWLLLLVVAVALGGCCRTGYEWKCCPVEEASSGEGPPGPDIDVGEGGGEGPPPPAADATGQTTTDCAQLEWTVDRAAAKRGPLSNSTINEKMNGKIDEGMTGVERDSRQTVALENFVLTFTYQDRPQVLIVSKYGAADAERLQWKLNGVVLQGREPRPDDVLPEDLFGCLGSLRGMRSDTGELVYLASAKIR